MKESIKDWASKLDPTIESNMFSTKELQWLRNRQGAVVHGYSDDHVIFGGMIEDDIDCFGSGRYLHINEEFNVRVVQEGEVIDLENKAYVQMFFENHTWAFKPNFPYCTRPVYDGDDEIIDGRYRISFNYNKLHQVAIIFDTADILRIYGLDGFM